MREGERRRERKRIVNESPFSFTGAPFRHGVESSHGDPEEGTAVARKTGLLSGDTKDRTKKRLR